MSKLTTDELAAIWEDYKRDLLATVNTENHTWAMARHSGNIPRLLLHIQIAERENARLRADQERSQMIEFAALALIVETTPERLRGLMTALKVKAQDIPSMETDLLYENVTLKQELARLAGDGGGEQVEEEEHDED
jgi:hypothetical protein